MRLYDISDQVQAHGAVSCPCRCLQCVDLLCVVNGLVLDHIATCTGQVTSAAGVHAATSMKCSRQKLAAWCWLPDKISSHGSSPGISCPTQCCYLIRSLQPSTIC